MGAEIIMALQTLVSREISPLAPAVVTVGAFHGGLKQQHHLRPGRRCS